MPAPTRWLIRGQGDLPEPLFLHVFDAPEGEVEMDLQADHTRALRFATFEDAERFVGLHRLVGVGASEYTAADLVAPATHPFDCSTAVA